MEKEVAMGAVVGKRKREQDKVVALELSSKIRASKEEGVDIKMNLPLRTSLLLNKELAV